MYIIQVKIQIQGVFFFLNQHSVQTEKIKYPQIKPELDWCFIYFLILKAFPGQFLHGSGQPISFLAAKSLMTAAPAGWTISIAPIHMLGLPAR